MVSPMIRISAGPRAGVPLPSTMVALRIASERVRTLLRAVVVLAPAPCASSATGRAMSAAAARPARRERGWDTARLLHIDGEVREGYARWGVDAISTVAYGRAG